MPLLLIVDDEPNIAFSIKECLDLPHLEFITASTARQGIALTREQQPDVVLLDIRLPDLSGLDAFEKIREFDPRLPCILMTAFSRTETAIEAMRRGAFDYLVKPVDVMQLQNVVAKALEVSRLSRKPAVVETDESLTPADHIVGTSAAMHDVYKAIGRIAPQDSTVLILGESGTGKELVARALYHYSQRSRMPFLAINCAALPETLLESELFGHERGAFTGADQRRIGKFEQVSGGTIFLDEIGDMSPATQAKALRLLQEQRFERIGGNITIETDVRIIAATNRDLNELVAEGKFRQDLLYRLNGFTISIPPLRDRSDDIPVLTDHFIRCFNAELGRNITTMTDEARQFLQSHDWPGNVRELESAVRFAMAHAAGNVITADCLPASCQGGSERSPSMSDLEALIQQLLAKNTTGIYERILQEVDRIALTAVMRHTNFNQVQAALLLGLSRMTLRSKLRAVGLLSAKTDTATTLAIDSSEDKVG
ncbi:response regulator [bacterium]|nr:response regulator [bacterium]